MKTSARPYAKALFSLAKDNNALSEWSVRLNFLAEIIKGLKDNAKNNTQNIKKLLLALLQETALNTPETDNLINVLEQYKRLLLLPFIAELFEEDKFLYEHMIRVQVTSAFELSSELQKKLKKSLEIRLQRDVTLECQIDTALIGGAMIRAGDWVMDGSVRAKLDKLKEEIL